MKQRLHNLRRLVAIKEQLRQSMQWKLARLDSDERAALADEAEIIAALNAEQPLHGLFVGLMARHLRAVSERIAAVRSAKDAEALRLQKETGQLRHSERMLVAAERQHDRMVEGKELANLIEAATSRDAASLPKASKAML
jgi:5,10-methylene-tetrahydrofolate dehydrogenase/methenyl tetrahydrofolate cyclohydrolase